MALCKYHKVCGLEAVEEVGGDSLCILHSTNPDKDKTEFSTALQKHERESKDLDFSHFVFLGDTFFCWNSFGGDAKFTKATFKGNARFDWATFEGNADFTGVTFSAEANFMGTKFKGDTKFKAGAKVNGGAKLEWDTSFAGAKFKGETILAGEFSGNAIFTKAEFEKRVFFSGAIFNGYAHFVLAKFSGETHFPHTRFGQGATFQWASFLARTFFHCPEREGDELLRIFSGSDVDFRHVIIDSNDAFIMQYADLQRCRLVGTDLLKAEISGAKWPRIDSPFPLIPGRLAVYDEVDPPQTISASWYSDIERLYCQLKQNYENRRDFDTAGYFHYGEKEMRRKNPETPWQRKFLLWMYWLVSGYGERCLRPLLCAALFLGLTTFCYVHWGLLILRDDHNNLVDCTKFWEVMVYGVRVMTLLKPANFEPSAIAGNLVNVAQSIVGPLLIGLFALAVRQRLKR